MFSKGLLDIRKGYPSLKSFFKNYFAFPIVLIALPFIANASHQSGDKYDVDEFNFLLAAIMTVPMGPEDWLSCIFWLVLSIVFGYIIGALAVIATSDVNTSRHTIHLRQTVAFSIEAILLMLVSTYFGLTGLIIPFAVLALCLIISGFWFSTKLSEGDSKKPIDDLEL